MTNKFRERGYPPDLLKIQRNKAEITPPDRTKKETRIPLVIKYHPWSQRLRTIVNQHWHILSKSYPRIGEFQRPPMICYKRAENIRDKIVRADVGSNKIERGQSTLSTPRRGTFPCLNCVNCSSVIKRSCFSHPHSGENIPIRGTFTCDSRFVVYILKCPCGLLYVGETSMRMKDRLSKHKSTIRKQNLLLPIPLHFYDKKHNISQLRYQIIEGVSLPRRGGDRNKLLLKREAYWIHRLQTMEPRGLNREYNVSCFL